MAVVVLAVGVVAVCHMAVVVLAVNVVAHMAVVVLAVELVEHVTFLSVGDEVTVVVGAGGGAALRAHDDVMSALFCLAS